MAKKQIKEQPLAMKYYDTDAEIIKKLKINFYIEGLTMLPKLMYKKQDGSYLYRINYLKDEKVKQSKVVLVSIVDNNFNFKNV